MIEMKVYSPNGFVSIKLLILLVIVICSLLTVVFAYSAARVQARDQQRVTDILQIRKVLELYRQENGFYPSGNGSAEPDGLSSYLDFWPTAPHADGNCTTQQNQYDYIQKAQGDDYQLTFCLGVGAGTAAAGFYTLNAHSGQ